MEETTWTLRVETPHENFERVQAFLALRVSFGWEEISLPENRDLFVIYYDDGAFLRDLAAELKASVPECEARLEETAKKDWQAAWREFFTPVECGARFVVLPPWLAHMEHCSRKAIVIEPKSAFGTGHHATTRLCLKALDALAEAGRIRRGGWFLDFGCGSGVLGIAASKLGMDGTGLDIDPVAIANARENRELNEATGIEFLRGGIEKVKREKFDLVMANILAAPLIDMAGSIMATLKKDGCLILSGVLDAQAEAVASAYKALGQPKILVEDEWRALVWS